jgi:hypothetical protein
MDRLMNHPVLVFVVTFAALWLAGRIGVAFRQRREEMPDDEHEDFGVILAATLTLLGLIIGFSFSMAISRYDQRKNYEEAEANAIGTEYVRADLLPNENAQKVRQLLKLYLEQRILFYETRTEKDLKKVNARTAELQGQLWEAVKTPALQQPSPIQALAVAGMNDVLNSQGYTQAAWWNRIPFEAWGLMWAIAICCNFMIGYYVRPAARHRVRLMVLPLVVAVSFFLISDIDSPRWGVIQVVPQNLVSLAGTMK